MKPTNEKSLLHFLFDQMDKLDRGEIDCQKAIAASKLAQQATKLYELEQRRAIIALKAIEMNTPNPLRELSSKGFDNTTLLLKDSTEY